MRGAVPPLSQMPSLRSTWLKHKDSFGLLMGCLAGETSKRKWLFWHQWVWKLLYFGLLLCVDIVPYISNLEGIFCLWLHGRWRDAKNSDPGMGKEEPDRTCRNQQETTLLAMAFVQRTVKTSVPICQSIRHQVRQDNNSFIQYFVCRQVQSLLQNDSST